MKGSNSMAMTFQSNHLPKVEALIDTSKAEIKIFVMMELEFELPDEWLLIAVFGSFRPLAFWFWDKSRFQSF